MLTRGILLEANVKLGRIVIVIHNIEIIIVIQSNTKVDVKIIVIAIHNDTEVAIEMSRIFCQL